MPFKSKATVFTALLLCIEIAQYCYCQDLNSSEIYSIKIEALQAEMLVQEKADRISHQANDLIREANDSLDELLSGGTVLSSITLTEGVGYAIEEAEKIVYLAEYIFHNSRNRSNDVRVWSRKSIREAMKDEQENGAEAEESDDVTSDQPENENRRRSKRSTDDAMDDATDSEDGKNETKKLDEEVKNCKKSSDPLRIMHNDRIMALVDDIVELSFNITAVYGFVADLVIDKNATTDDAAIFDAADSKGEISRKCFIIQQAAGALKEAEKTAQTVNKETERM